MKRFNYGNEAIAHTDKHKKVDKNLSNALSQATSEQVTTDKKIMPLIQQKLTEYKQKLMDINLDVN